MGERNGIKYNLSSFVALPCEKQIMAAQCRDSRAAFAYKFDLFFFLVTVYAARMRSENWAPLSDAIHW
jgi:hypothetical protein